MASLRSESPLFLPGAVQKGSAQEDLRVGRRLSGVQHNCVEYSDADFYDCVGPALVARQSSVPFKTTNRFLLLPIDVYPHLSMQI